MRKLPKILDNYPPMLSINNYKSGPGRVFDTPSSQKSLEQLASFHGMTRAAVSEFEDWTRVLFVSHTKHKGQIVQRSQKLISERPSSSDELTISMCLWRSNKLRISMSPEAMHLDGD
ncbi:hypothetical protein KIN20_033392 [Parelaphostrongylus tenuis]|uniref:Uncharacterized protein n=1 Tax=Parelaphostrongylus tenuis TaxID=148309 RepID=A0AAD5R8D7_PARTN|nr:hypothetical protein KIN20_033392 [Parelaphostrongylus tenuis]